MKAMFVPFGAALAAVLAASTAQAQNFGCCGRQAPDCCGPSSYAPNWFGAYYGPNYNVNPGCSPYNGPVGFPSFNVIAGGRGGGGPGVAPPLSFPTHPYARSPRDFFMVDDESSRAPVPSGYGFSAPVASQPYVAPTPAALTPSPIVVPAPSVAPAPK
jgi:hypothetical protein